MSSIEIASIVFVCVFGSAMLGLLVGNVLPEPHLSAETKDVVRLGTALIATIAALVLSLLISSAKTSFDNVSDELLDNAARVISLDRALADYGPETKETRDLLKRSYAARIDMLFPSEKTAAGQQDNPESTLRAESIQGKLWQLSPKSDAQRGFQAQAVELAEEVSATRWLLFLQRDEPMPTTLLVVLTLWLAIIFATFGMFARRNATVVTALFVCALSVSGAVFLILEMDSPFSGLMQASSAPMRDALASLGQ